MACRNAKKLFVAILFLAMCLCKTVVGAENNPEDIVKKYYVADLEGARLNTTTYKTLIHPLIIWEHEPGWDFSFITKKAYISNIEKLNNKISIEVRYENIGFLNGDDLIEIDFTEIVIFSLINEREQWKIQEPIFPPHVSARAFAKHFEQRIAKEKDKSSIEKLRILINRLKEMSDNSL